MAEITWTFEAERWLSDIFEYIAAENPAAALKTVQGIYDRAQVLREFPHIGQRYSPSSRSVRVLLYGHYRIAYLVKDDAHIEILGVFHGALASRRTIIAKYQMDRKSTSRSVWPTRKSLVKIKQVRLRATHPHAAQGYR